MTEPRPPRRRRQDRARRVMLAVTAVCVTAAATPAVNQLLVAGWRVFITRPAGVGASSPDASAQRQAVSAQHKNPALAPQPAVTPGPATTVLPPPPRPSVATPRPGRVPPPPEHVRHRWRG